MSFSILDLRVPDYVVLVVIAVGLLVSIITALWMVPWKGAPNPRSPLSGFSSLWPCAVIMELLLALLLVSQSLRLPTVWGAHSVVFGESATSWTADGTNCRIYLTAALGVLSPLAALVSLFLARAALSPPGALSSGGEVRSWPSLRLLGKGALLALPVALAQAASAWVSLWLTVDGVPPEEAPRSVLWYFFAVYGSGSAQQCDGPAGCTLCTYPAAAVIAHCVWRAAVVGALWVAVHRSSRADEESGSAAESAVPFRLRALRVALFLVAGAEVAALGASVAFLPFGWPNQICWLVFFCATALAAALGPWQLAAAPLAALPDAASKKSELWQHESSSLDDDSPRGATRGGVSLIKAYSSAQAPRPSPGSPPRRSNSGWAERSRGQFMAAAHAPAPAPSHGGIGSYAAPAHASYAARPHYPSGARSLGGAPSPGGYGAGGYAQRAPGPGYGYGSGARPGPPPPAFPHRAASSSSYSSHYSRDAYGSRDVYGSRDAYGSRSGAPSPGAYGPRSSPGGHRAAGSPGPSRAVTSPQLGARAHGYASAGPSPAGSSRSAAPSPKSSASRSNSLQGGERSPFK